MEEFNPVLVSPIRQSEGRIGKLYEALAVAQEEFPVIEKKHIAEVVKNGNFLYSFRYADLADVLNAIRPILAKNRIALLQFPLMRQKTLYAVTRLAFKDGSWIECDYPVANLGDGINHQTVAGAFTYAKRYSLTAITGVAAEEDINPEKVEDGNEVAGPAAEPDKAPPPPPARAKPAQTPPKPSAPPAEAGKTHPLIAEMLRLPNKKALEAWHEENANRIHGEDPNWQNDVFYPRYDALKEEFQGG